MEIQYTSQLAILNGVKMCIYGPSGVGKTMLAATAPNPKILSAENKLLSLSQANQIRIFGRAMDIPVVVVDTVAKLEAAYEFIYANPDLDENGNETIILDSGTEIAEKLLKASKDRFNDGRQIYGEYNDRMVEVLKKFRDLPGRHVVFICRQLRLGEGANTMFGPSLSGKTIQNDLPYHFDEVLHMAVAVTPEGVKYRCLQTATDIQFEAKDSSGALDPIEEPNLTNIINKIKNG